MSPTGRQLAWCSLLLIAAGPVAAQAPLPEQAFWQLSDSLEQLTDTAILRQLHNAAQSEVEATPGNALAEARAALVALRLLELNDDLRLVYPAARAFSALTLDHPHWGVGWTGLGLAELAEARSGRSNTHGIARMFGFDPAGEMVKMFVRGAGPDTAEVRGIVTLAHRALRSRVRLDEEVALRTVRKLPVRVLTMNPAAALMRARLERELGDKDSALVVLERAAAVHRDNPMILRAQAQIRFLVGRNDGAEPWYRGLELATGSVLGSFERDLRLVVPDTLMSRLLQASPSERANLLRTFWQAQDPDGLATRDERLAEHYRRLEVARRHYVLAAVHRQHKTFELDTLGAEVFDARGEMMLRHGSPRVRTSIGDHGGTNVEVTLRIIGMPPNESWAYARGDGADQFYHFIKLTPDAEFQAVESVFDILAQSQQFKRFRPGMAPLAPGDSTRRTILVHGAELVSIVAQELLVSRHAMSPLYSDMINQGLASADSMQARERAIGRESLAREFSYELGYELSLDAAVTILAVGSDVDGPVLQVAFAMRSAGLMLQVVPGGVVYPVRMRVAVVSPEGEIIAQVDTVRRFRSPSPLGPAQDVVGYIPISVPAGHYRVRVALEVGRRGMLSQPTMVQVPGSSTTLTLSDVSIGTRSVPIRWRSPTADTAWANPRGSFRQDQEMQLFFEVAGLATGTHYETQIAMDRVDRDAPSTCSGQGRALTLAFDSEHPGGVTREQRAVSLDRLRSGEYMMTVTVSTDAGARATRCRRFTVVRG